MSLSDELLEQRERLDAIRKRVGELVSTLGGESGFLVDERGAPFAAVGNVEFGFPHPLSGLAGANTLLEALIGEADADRPPEPEGVLVQPVGSRAILAVTMGPPPWPQSTAETRARLERGAKELETLF